jgi:hypothetical protein
LFRCSAEEAFAKEIHMRTNERRLANRERHHELRFRSLFDPNRVLAFHATATAASMSMR